MDEEPQNLPQLRRASCRNRRTCLPLLLGGDELLEVLGARVTPSPLFVSAFFAALDKVKPGDAERIVGKARTRCMRAKREGDA